MLFCFQIKLKPCLDVEFGKTLVVAATETIQGSGESYTVKCFEGERGDMYFLIEI